MRVRDEKYYRSAGLETPAYRLLRLRLPAPGFIAYLVVKPGRQPIAEGEGEQAAPEVCEMAPPVVSPAETAPPGDKA